jgi:hypothetical protein
MKVDYLKDSALHLETGVGPKGDSLAQPLTETGFERHVHACNNVRLPGNRRPFLVCSDQVGWVTPAIMQVLGGFPEIQHSSDGVTLRTPEALPRIARALAERGVFGWRGEEFDVRARQDGPSLARIDRGAIPSFGIQATGVHLNGLVQRPNGLYLWIARRAKDKKLDPGKLDHIVAGGVPAGLDPWQTLIKEAAEEASIPPGLAAKAVAVSSLHYTMQRAEGLRRDFLYCYDLMLPPAFMPVPADGEVEGFELWPIEQVADTVRLTDAFKFNVSLVLIDLFIRRGLITGSDAATLTHALELAP